MRHTGSVEILPDPVSTDLLSKPADENILAGFKWGAWFSEESNLLYLRRDIFGTVPLYYLHVPGSFVAFSTSLVSLVTMPISKPYLKLDRSRIGNYLSYRQDQSRSYSSNSFYKHIKTVLPGHMAVVSPVGVHSNPYVTFSPEKWDKIRSPEEAGEVFRNYFLKSVEKSLKNTSEPFGSHLSGGMDSSSISAAVKIFKPESKLHTLYLDTRTKYSDESSYASTVADEIRSTHHNVIPLQNDFELISQYTGLYGHPECMVISPSAQGSLLEKAAELGCASLLNGHGGDSLVGSGLEHIKQTYAIRDWDELKELIPLRARYATLHRAFRQWDSYDEKTKTKLYTRNLIVNQFFSDTRKLSIKNTLKLLWSASTTMNVSLWHFLKKGLIAFGNRVFPSKYLPSSVLLSNFNTTTTSETSKRSTNLLRESLPEKYKIAFDDVFNAQSIVASEEFFALSNHYGVENLYPLYDKDLFEFCMSISMRSKFGEGLGRTHFREAMKGILPETVRLRPVKANFSLYGREAALRLAKQSADLMKVPENPVWEFVNKEKFDLFLKILSNDALPEYKHSRSEFFVFRTISFAIWLKWLADNNLYFPEEA
ncbi:asparagine synthase-related protein [Dyadobacter arcticus]|uniref:asparagine synthase (glutamine-hydrolyzing) n=1 Tax=Dyadobacter arcticus TaxID=1078754 RepID=A0ABX0UEU6_9BACT|nr:asparagine synthetase B family protein [Dyadobacter arcticus]NIJ51506.1 asparagine synthase (glutamine-hydrolysing) [Dyadobacter arcticus]